MSGTQVFWRMNIWRRVLSPLVWRSSMMCRLGATVTSAGGLCELCLRYYCWFFTVLHVFVFQEWTVTLSWLPGLLKPPRLQWDRPLFLELQAQTLAAVRTECVTSMWCGVRPVRRNTSAGRAMQSWLQEDAQPHWKIWRARTSARVRQTPQVTFCFLLFYCSLRSCDG